MQSSFDFGAREDITYIRDQLVQTFGHLRDFPRRTPMDQLIKSLISGKTLDAVSEHAFERLVYIYPRWRYAAAAPPKLIEMAIADVTYADRKAGQLVPALCIIQRHHPDFRLDFLGSWPVEQALIWLENLPGVGRKVSASALNFSTLHRPAFVADSHVQKVLTRYGCISLGADSWDAYGFVMPATEGWGADALAELHVVLKQLGQTICLTANPHCWKCPLSSRCKRMHLPHH